MRSNNPVRTRAALLPFRWEREARRANEEMSFVLWRFVFVLENSSV